VERSHVRTIVAIRRLGTTKSTPTGGTTSSGFVPAKHDGRALDNLKSDALLTAMIVDQRREVLERLAQGKLSPEEAEHHLAALESEKPAAPVAEDATARHDTIPLDVDRLRDATVGGQPPRPTAGTVVAKLSGGGLIEIAGDESALEARIEGPNNCSVQSSGDDIEVSGQVGDDALVVYPAAAHLDVVANGAEAVVRGISSTFRARLNVGQARVEGLLTSGSSEIEANVGQLDIAFRPDSDVRVVVRCAAHTEAGEGLRKVGRGEWAVGSGSALLEIKGHPGAISLRVD
jgi:hypothetical protein